MLNDIELLRPITKILCKRFVEECKKAGYPVRIVETKRLQVLQTAYYAQGRETLEKVNELRKLANVYLIKESENRYTVTDVKDVTTGAHYYGLAWDFVPLKDEKDWWEAPSNIWNVCITIALKLEEKGIRLESGGSWRTHDSPHLQVLNWKKYR